MTATVRHYAQHVDWFMLGLVYALFVWGLWGNPRWWVAALLAPVIPVAVALRGHLMCSMSKDVQR